MKPYLQSILLAVCILSAPAVAHAERSTQSDQEQIIESLLFVYLSNEIKMRFDQPMQFRCVTSHSFKKTIEGEQFLVDMVAYNHKQAFKVKMMFAHGGTAYGDWEITKFQKTAIDGADFSCT
ncbi:hypothetical protein ABC345_17505 [Shouchella sp. 1P09AA]|uniref:hypothetical protein n=1 Tax=unclassified Shouchella TaxID=2893065 RepID=UPI0039A229F9